MFWFALNFRWIWLDKRKNISANLLKVRGHVDFRMFSHLQHKIFVAETKKKSNWFDFFLFQQQKIEEKSCKTKKLNVGTRWNIYLWLQHISFFVAIA